MPEPLEYQFAPAVIFAGGRVPIDELIGHFRQYIKAWLPDEQASMISWDDSEKGTVVAFPMHALDFLGWGAFLMEQLHSACEVTEADEGNEFLACFEEYAPGADPTVDPLDPEKEPPAAAMYASLFVSLDGGLTWLDRRSLRLNNG